MQCQCTHSAVFHRKRCPHTASFSVIRDGKKIMVCSDCYLSDDKDITSLSYLPDDKDITSLKHDEVLDSRDEY